MKVAERLFEQMIWNSRLVVLIAVVMSLIVAFVMFYIATVDAVLLTYEARHYVDPLMTQPARQQLHLATVAHVAEVVDGYLFAVIMIVFGLGLYELFVSKIDAAEDSDLAQRLLLIRSVDDLKERLAKVVFLILVVRYFQFALEAPVHGPLDLLFLAIGIALVALSLFLTGDVVKKNLERRPPTP